MPPGCTPEAAECDTCYNRVFKFLVEASYSKWVIAGLRKQLNAGTQPADMSVNLSLTELKPASLRWALDAHNAILDKKAAIARAFDGTGTATCWDPAFQLAALSSVNRITGAGSSPSESMPPFAMTDEQRLRFSLDPDACDVPDEAGVSVDDLEAALATAVGRLTRLRRVDDYADVMAAPEPQLS